VKISCQEELLLGGSFAEKLKNIEKYGFDGVELSGAALNEEAGRAERKAALRDSPVKASSICGGHPTDLVHPDPARRQASIDALKRHLDLAAEFGAAGPITVPIFNREERVPDLSPWMTRAELERELLLAQLSELIGHAEQAGTAILLEPLNRYESNALPQQIDGARIVRELASPHVRTCPRRSAPLAIPSDTFIWPIARVKSRGVAASISRRFSMPSKRLALRATWPTNAAN
jgi:sugar phosphate isomerase/epimerase